MICSNVGFVGYTALKYLAHFATIQALDANWPSSLQMTNCRATSAGLIHTRSSFTIPSSPSSLAKHRASSVPPRPAAGPTCLKLLSRYGSKLAAYSQLPGFESAPIQFIACTCQSNHGKTEPILTMSIRPFKLIIANLTI